MVSSKQVRRNLAPLWPTDLPPAAIANTRATSTTCGMLSDNEQVLKATIF
jgi:hypothetical protein